jgi:hypothetical protein
MAPAAAPAAGGMMSGLGSTLVQGMAWGVGTQMAGRAVDAVLGGRTVVHEHVDVPAKNSEPQAMAPASAQSSSASSGKCQWESQQFSSCLRDYNNDIKACESFSDMLKQCQRQ